jgi:hypothetical protein
MIDDRHRPVIFDCVVDKKRNCFPMIPSGKAHNEMILPARPPGAGAPRGRHDGFRTVDSARTRHGEGRGKGEPRVEALRLADAFRARVIDAGTESFIFEITGASDKIESFINLMLPLGLVEVSRTGIVAIARGADAMSCAFITMVL